MDCGSVQLQRRGRDDFKQSRQLRRPDVCHNLLWPWPGGWYCPDELLTKLRDVLLSSQGHTAINGEPETQVCPGLDSGLQECKGCGALRPRGSVELWESGAGRVVTRENPAVRLPLKEL